MILHEIFRVVSRFPRYISCYIAENRFPLGQCKSYSKERYKNMCFFNNYPFGALNKIYKPIWIQSLYVLQYMYEAIILYKSKYFFAFFKPLVHFS